MSQASDLLSRLAAPPATTVEEPHIVIGEDRFITVPNSLKRIAVQYDHNVETVVFDCPRFWDGLDMSQMIVYINYMLPNKEKAAYIAENVEADGDIMHFTWTISSNVTQEKGQIAFLVCVKKTGTDDNGDPIEINHWNSELCTTCYISEGMECDETLDMEHPDIVTQLLERMTVVEQAEETMARYVEEAEGAAVAASGFRDNVEAARDEVIGAADYIRNSYAPAIKGSASGEIIRVDDVSPIEHDVKCRVINKNLFKLTGDKSSDGVTLTVDEDGVVHLNGTATGAGNFQMSIDLDKAGKYYLADFATGVYPSDENARCQVYDPTSTKAISTRNISESGFVTSGNFNKTTVWCRIRFETGHVYNDCTLKPTLMYEEIPSEYIPNVPDLSTVKVTRCGKNLAYTNHVHITGTVGTGGSIGSFGNSILVKDIPIKKNTSYIVSMTRPSEVATPRVFLYNGVLNGLTHTATYNELVPTGRGVEKVALTGALVNTAGYEYMAITVGGTSTYSPGTVVDFNITNLQLEIGDMATTFEHYSGSTVTPATDGTCSVTSVNPNMTIFTDNPDVTVEAEYNRDTTTAIPQAVDMILQGKYAEMSAEEYESVTKDPNTFYFVY